MTTFCYAAIVSNLTTVLLQALTTFCRANWLDGQVDTIEVQLERDARLGLGITVAGYVHRKGRRAYSFKCCAN